MEKKIELKFDKMVVDLTGNKFGRNTYKKQVEPYINAETLIVAVIPSVINDIGSSFVQGMYYELGEQYGKIKARQMLRIDCNKQEIVDKIKKCLETYDI